jgi:hypothetical protein
MTHEQALARCAELNADAEREREWFPKQVGSDDWEVVWVTIPGFNRTGPLKETIESRPRPSEPPDPRPTIIRNIPPYGPG